MHISLAPRTRRAAVIAGVALWAAGVAGALWGLTLYKSTPGAEGAAPAVWPAASTLARDPARPTLLMFVHARCPCTRASVSELATLVAHTAERARVVVVADEPNAGTESLTRARSIPGVVVIGDAGGIEARRFGALTSGFTAVYDASGALLFRGGITGSRGHVGDNVGRAAAERAVLAAARGDEPQHTPTFGCSLFDEENAQ